LYKHGVYYDENDTPITLPRKSGTLQVVVGTAPVNLTASPNVNEPVLLLNFGEAVKKLGYSDDFKKFSLCQAMDATFKVFNVAPVVMINVLDPSKHKVAVPSKAVDVVTLEVIEPVEGVILSSLVVKNDTGATTYDVDADYTAEFNTLGQLVIKVDSEGAAAAATELSIEYDKLDPSKVTEDDVIGAYTALGNKYTGIQCIKEIYPRLGLVSAILLAPGYTHLPKVARALEVASKKINGSFNAVVLNDLDATEKDYTKVPAWKNENGYTQKGSIALYPKLKIGSTIYAYSALLAAMMQAMDVESKGVPNESPSNKALPVTATVFEDGIELFLDQEQANLLNGHGIVTAINMAGWRVWGNNTAAYPSITDPKERFISTRRMFNYVGNNFVLSYFSKVDKIGDYRLIESVVDSENMVLNSLMSQNKIAAGRIIFNIEDNPVTQILDGTIKFITMLSVGSPAKEIINTLEFDPVGLMNSLGGN